MICLCGKLLVNSKWLFKAFDADIFFDDQRKHCESARQHVATGQAQLALKTKEVVSGKKS